MGNSRLNRISDNLYKYLVDFAATKPDDYELHFNESSISIEFYDDGDPFTFISQFLSWMSQTIGCDKKNKEFHEFLKMIRSAGLEDSQPHSPRLVFYNWGYLIEY